MKKRTILPLALLLTFALWLTPTPAAEEWVLHKTLTDFGGDINFNCVAFSPSGNHLAIGTDFNNSKLNARIYNGNTFVYLNGRDYKTDRHSNITAVACRKGWYEAAFGIGVYIERHNTRSGAHIRRDFPRIAGGKTDRILSLAYSPDGEYLAIGNDAGQVIIDHGDGAKNPHRAIRLLRGHTAQVNSVAWSSDGQTLASGSDDGTVRLWNPNNGVNFAVLRGHRKPVRAVAWSRDGRTLASGGTDSTVRIWNVGTERTIRTIRYRNWVNGLRFHPRQQILGVVGSKGVGLYDPSSGREIQYLGGHTDWAVALDFHPSGTYLASGGFDNTVRIWKKIPVLPYDVNKDGKVDINDLIAVARDYGKTGSRPTDVNNDKRVDIKDLTAVAKAVNPNFAAPTLAQEVTTLPFTAKEIQQWIQDAKKQGVDTEGIATLEQLLTAVLHQANPPKETALLANYPNPFNPETWIPYQLAKPAEVTVSIHAADGKLVRTLALGQLPAGVYQARDRAAYWDGKNEQGESVASGVYFYTLKAGEFSATRKMLIRK